jgi:glycosyltransferase involved in cell wall biosynthesis
MIGHPSFKPSGLTLIKVLLVTGSYPPMRCGVGDYTAGLARALRDSGKVRVGVLIGGHEPEEEPGIEMIRIRGWSLRNAFGALRAAFKWKPDIVHLQLPTQGYRSGWLPWIFPLLLQLVRIRVVQTWHEFMPMGLRSLPLLLTAGAVVVVRPNYLDSTAGWCRRFLANRRIVFVPSASSIPRARLTGRERADLHAKLAAGQDRVVSYFGFAYPHKGMEALFEIADPKRDRLVLICVLQETDPYHRLILDKCKEAPWDGRVSITGFLPAEEIANVLAVSDAVVLPFTEGGGDWNSSLQAAAVQGVFLVTTSLTAKGYDPKHNVHHCPPGDVACMRAALESRMGHRIEPAGGTNREWTRIAKAHLRVYGESPA